MYHSKKCRYVQLYVDSDKADQVMEDLKKKRYVKRACPPPSQIYTYFVWGGFTTIGDPICGHRSLENAII